MQYKKFDKVPKKSIKMKGIVYTCDKKQKTDLQNFLNIRPLKPAHEADYKRQHEGTVESLNPISTGDFERL